VGKHVSSETTTDTLPHSQKSATYPDESSSQPVFIIILNFIPSTSSSPQQWPTLRFTITTLQALLVSHIPRSKYKLHAKVQHSEYHGVIAQ